MKEHDHQIDVSPETFIRLQGEPYQQFVNNGQRKEYVDCSMTHAHLVDSTGYRDNLPLLLSQVGEELKPLTDQGGYYSLDNSLKHGQSLSFEESFSLIAFVCSALNKPLYNSLSHRINNLGDHQTHLLQATALLAAMSAKESYIGLTAEEIAGMVAATVHLDTVVRIFSENSLIAFGGMGGDRGYPLNGDRSKLFSLSTLAALALAVDSPVHKHHSYPNTSKVAGQSAIEAYGARSDFFSVAAYKQVLRETNLIMTSCHDTRSLHTLSHALKGETINHVIGPLAFTTDARIALHTMIGVNEKIHPELITEALRIIDNRGFQRYDQSAVYFGTDYKIIDPRILDPSEYSKDPQLRTHVMIDEVAPPPYATIAAFLVNGENSGSYVLYPEDFYTLEELKCVNMDLLRIKNTREDILAANYDAITFSDRAKTMYLAMTVGLGLFVKYSLSANEALDPKTRRVNRDMLRHYTAVALSFFVDGAVLKKLEDYVAVTQKYAGGRYI